MGVVTIGDVAKLVRGVSYKKEVSRNEPSENYVALLRANNIVNGAFSFDELVYVPSSLVNSEQFLDEGDIMITMSSGSKAHVGKVALSKTKLDCVFGAFCAKIKTDEAVLPKYLYYVMLDGEFRKHIEHQSKGTNINNLKRDYILGFSFNLPPLEEQRRIVARIEELFSELDAAVATLERTKEQLAVYRQAVITDVFLSSSENVGRVILSEIAQISSGITKGRKLNPEDTISLPYLRVANVQNGYLDLSEIKYIQLKESEKTKYLLQYGDVLYTEGGDRDKVGRGTIWKNEIEDCVHQNHIFKARVNPDLALSEYISYWSMSTDARNYFYSMAKQTVNLASINKTVLSNLKLPLPELNIQKKIVSEIESRLSVCDKIEETVTTALQKAEAIRQSILKQAFAGDL